MLKHDKYIHLRAAKIFEVETLVETWSGTRFFSGHLDPGGVWRKNRAPDNLDTIPKGRRPNYWSLGRDFGGQNFAWSRLTPGGVKNFDLGRPR